MATPNYSLMHTIASGELGQWTWRERGGEEGKTFSSNDRANPHHSQGAIQQFAWACNEENTRVYRSSVFINASFRSRALCLCSITGAWLCGIILIIGRLPRGGLVRSTLDAFSSYPSADHQPCIIYESVQGSAGWHWRWSVELCRCKAALDEESHGNQRYITSLKQSFSHE